MAMVAKQLSLAKHRVNISASLEARPKASSGFTDSGFTDADLNRYVGAVAQTLLSRGAQLAFGHDFRPGGVMGEILRIAQAYHPRLDPGAPVKGAPLITACVAWPNEPYSDSSELRHLKGILVLEQVAVPPDLPAMSAAQGRLERQDKTTQGSYLEARTLTAMRRYLTKLCTARICCGGKRSGFSGRGPGIVEEAWMSLEDDKPLYLSSLLGGVTSDLIAAVKGKPMPAKFCEPDPSMAKQYRQRTAKGGVDADAQLLESKNIWRAFSSAGVAGLAKNNGLSEAENKMLFEAVTLAEVLGLIVRGLARVRPKAPRRAM